MTSSRSNRWLIVLACLGLWVTSAHAGRKRLVVLDFDGPSAEKFHGDVVKLLKKTHTVIAIDKWNTTAEELGADTINDKNVKKVAKKLKIDGVVTGKIEKRREEYIVRIKLRAGTSGSLIGNQVQTKSTDARLDAQSQRDLKDELMPAIDELEANHGGAEEEAEEEEKPAKKKKVVEEVEEEIPAPKKSGFARKNGEDEAKKKKVEEEEVAPPPPTKKDDKKKKKADEEERAALATKKQEEEAAPPPPKKRVKEVEAEEEEEGKKTASADKEEDEENNKVEEEDEEPAGPSDKELDVSVSKRAIDAAIGLSFKNRNLSFSYEDTLGRPPPGYRQTIPVAGAMVDLTIFPLAFNKKAKGVLAGLGITGLYDRVLIISSQKKYTDSMGMQATADLKTEEDRFAFGAVFRYPLGTGATAPVVGGQVTYGKQKFTVAQELPNMEKTDIPNVEYTLLTPGAFIRYPLSSKIILNADAAFHLVLGTGAISQTDQYGKASVLGFEFEGGLDYMIKTNIFIRAGVRFQTFGFSFQGDPMSQTNTRDTDPEQDVQGARDSYLGGAATVGYLY